MSSEGASRARSSSTILYLGGLFLVIFTAPNQCLGEAREPKKVHYDLVVAAWKDRQRQVRTFDFLCSGQEFERKPSDAELSMSDRVPAGGPSPTDITFPITMRFVYEAKGRARLDYKGRIWSSHRGGYVDEEAISLFDGHLCKTLFPSSQLGFPSAHIYQGTASKVGNNLRVLPLSLALRPFDKTLGMFDPARLVLTDKRGVTDGRTCLILRYEERPTWSDPALVWVDPERGFLPLRCEQKRRGATVQSISISYLRDAKHGWVPSAWTNTQLAPKTGEVVNSVTAKVTQYHINETIPDATFDVSFPPGTYVHDYRTNKEYILREGKPPRPVLEGELQEGARNYQELLHSEPPGSSGNRRLWGLVALNLALFIAIVAVVVLWRRRRKQATTPPPAPPA